eukprot:CAMPEP_0174984316 /NCGR_PEP_ID=MMETSP0004_2-20121128/17655_1 /TAXON_ID=420556 /ORGANISM="Ochromonas sp., Strain CCMP1393" /LENGTH=790 /DNA_ID=CAMNT_0016236713 /DNA_START=56 /DNA_END=2428 /DNA_ORIENTATION=-
MADKIAAGAEDQPKLSKKELNKLARKEGKKNNTPKEDNSKYSIVFCKSMAPDLAHLLETVLGEVGVLKFCINKGSESHFPLLTTNVVADTTPGSISGDLNIARFLLRVSTSDKAAALLGAGNAWYASQVDQWLDVYLMAQHNATMKEGVVTLLNSHLSDKTFLVGNCMTLADIAMWMLMRKSGFSSTSTDFAQASRWYALITSLLPATLPPMAMITYVPPTATGSTATGKGGDKGGAKGGGKGVVAAAGKAEGGDGDAAAAGAGGTCPPLEGAVEGQVCTRFPPEPSGYLHIGHAKAVLLNQYYAQRYNGKLLVRFDDTNPSKEKEEFQENILRDLATLNVVPHAVSFSSDHFATCETLARKMIAEGKGYMDDTDQETMQAERMDRKDSKHRNTTPAENLKIFEQLLQGAVEARGFCLRAKIDMQSVNGTMRDPVLYRFNDTPHHRTGTKFKAYPTYDFACPIIDSVEGVTHALRTTEYNDRDEQYHWIQEALQLRPVKVHAFGKMNFIHTVLSKRKLNWFVEQKLVEGWFDPRFPTIQGCVRRGMNVDALKNFIINQGASRRVITMEWDKFWSENKKVLEEFAPRYMGVTNEDKVELLLENVAAEVTAHSVQLHPQKPEMGTRVMRRSNVVYLDQLDAATYKEGEEITLLRWGNVRITAIEYAGSGANSEKIVRLRGTYDATATNFSKTKKATWIAAVPDLVPCQVFEFDHLITKAKLTDDDKFQDFVNPVTKVESMALADPLLRTVAAGEVVQLERKGFFRVDKPFGGSADKPAVLFLIPDGRVVKKK